MRHFIVATLAALLASCGSVELAVAQRAPVLKLLRPDSIVAYAQPAIYFTWWQEIANCEGLELPIQEIGRVQFFEVKAEAFTPIGVRELLGATFAREEQIFLATPFIQNPKLVKHEMLHQILFWNGFDFGIWHPAEFFDRCGLAPWGQ